MDKLLQDMDRVYREIQNLHLEPTRHNTTIIVDTLQVMEAVYAFVQKELEEKAKQEVEVETDGNADTE